MHSYYIIMKVSRKPPSAHTLLYSYAAMNDVRHMFSGNYANRDPYLHV